MARRWPWLNRRPVQRRQAEARLPSQVAERRLRPRVGNDQWALERQAGRHDLPEHRPDRVAREGAVCGRGQPLEHGTLALRNVKGLAPLALAAPDLAYDLRAPVEQREDLIVDTVDRRAQRREIVFGTSWHGETIYPEGPEPPAMSSRGQSPRDLARYNR